MQLPSLSGGSVLLILRVGDCECGPQVFCFIERSGNVVVGHGVVDNRSGGCTACSIQYFKLKYFILGLVNLSFNTPNILKGGWEWTWWGGWPCSLQCKVRSAASLGTADILTTISGSEVMELDLRNGRILICDFMKVSCGLVVASVTSGGRFITLIILTTILLYLSSSRNNWIGCGQGGPSNGEGADQSTPCGTSLNKLVERCGEWRGRPGPPGSWHRPGSSGGWPTSNCL